MSNISRSLIAFAVVVASLSGSSAALAEPAASKPPAKTIVLVHGAFADGSSWDKVVPLLLAKGYNVVAVHQPLTGAAEDIAATRRAIDAAPGDVVLVGHSYAGLVITEAGNDEKVVALVYVAAFGPEAGESINDIGKGKPAPAWQSALTVRQGPACPCRYR